MSSKVAPLLMRAWPKGAVASEWLKMKSARPSAFRSAMPNMKSGRADDGIGFSPLCGLYGVRLGRNESMPIWVQPVPVVNLRLGSAVTVTPDAQLQVQVRTPLGPCGLQGEAAWQLFGQKHSGVSPPQPPGCGVL